MKKEITNYNVLSDDYNHYFEDWVGRKERMKKEQNRTALFIVLLIIAFLGAALLETMYLKIGL